MRQIIKDNPKYAKVNGSYVVNTDIDEYQQALKRRAKLKEVDQLKHNMHELQIQMNLLLARLGQTNGNQ